MYPVTVKRIVEANPSTDTNFLFDGVDVYNVKLVGMVFDKVERKTDVSFVIDDGTGKISCTKCMGYALSKLEIDSDVMDGSSSDYEVGVNVLPKAQLDNDIVQLTKLRSEPNENLRRLQPQKREFPVSTVRMLAGREANVSGRGRFSQGDHRHVLSRYLPVNGPWVVDQMSTRAYVSQFSTDGSRFIAAFQGSQIRIYDVDGGWKV